MAGKKKAMLLFIKSMYFGNMHKQICLCEGIHFMLLLNKQQCYAML